VLCEAGHFDVEPTDLLAWVGPSAHTALVVTVDIPDRLLAVVVRALDGDALRPVGLATPTSEIGRGRHRPISVGSDLDQEAFPWKTCWVTIPPR
jgi:hypothetical protein